MAETPQKDERPPDGLNLVASKLDTFVHAADGLAKISIAVIGIVYCVGLLIHSVHLMRYGVFYLNLLSVEFIMAGALWAFLTFVAYLFSYVLITQVHSVWTSARSKGKRVIDSAHLLYSAVLLFSSTVLFFTFSEGSKPSIQLKTFAAMLGILLLNALAIYILFFSLRKRFTDAPEPSGTDPTRWLSFVLLLFLGLSLYGRFVFPKLTHKIGGGASQTAVFTIKRDKMDSLAGSGLPIDPTTRMTAPVDIVLEGQDFYLLVVNNPPYEGARVMRVSKDYFDSAYYISSKDTRIFTF